MERRYIALSGMLLIALSVLAISTWNLRFSISDAVAQFLPISIQGYRSIKLLELPTFNFYQFAGHPLFQIGYFPVLYPLFWLSAAISESLLGEIQLAWDLMGFLQIIINGLIAAAFARRILGLSPILSICAGLSIGFEGIVIYLGGEWFFINACVGLTLAVLYCFHQALWKASHGWALLCSVMVAFLFFASNINLIFYALHFIGLGAAIFILEWWLESRSVRAISGILPILTCIFGTLLLVGPYLFALVEYSHGSVREAGRVPIEFYFWTAYNPEHLLKYSWWPTFGKPEFPWHTPFIYYIGLVPCFGLVLTPAIFVLALLRRIRIKWSYLFFLLAATAFSLALALGPVGGLGWVLYDWAPYNWFRHSIKWVPFFQTFAILLGLFCLDKLIASFSSRLYYRLSVLSLLITFGLLLRFVLIVEHPKRFTDVELPLKAPTLAFDPHFRHVGLWHRGKEYETDIPGRILGHDYSSLWQLPSVTGYEPMVMKQNIGIALGNYFPGYFLDASSLNLPALQRWGTRYIRVPSDQAAETLNILQKRYRYLALRDLGEDPALNIHVLELPRTAPLVFSRNRALKVEDFWIDGTSVVAKVVAEAPSRLIFSWLFNDHYQAVLDSGEMLEISPDSLGRVRVKLDRPGSFTVRLRYYPKRLIWLFRVGWGLFAVIVVVFVVSRTQRESI